MHGGYARPPCGVTLTGSIRARTFHTRFFYPRRTGLRVLPCAGCKAEESSPRSRLKAKRLRHMSKK